MVWLLVSEVFQLWSLIHIGTEDEIKYRYVDTGEHRLLILPLWMILNISSITEVWNRQYV